MIAYMAHRLLPLLLAGVLTKGAVLAAPAVAPPAPPAPPAPTTAPRRPIVVLDPGHGGPNGGASGPEGIREKRITLEIGRRLASRLERETDARVVLTREADDHVGLRERAQIANGLEADLLLSLHCNSSGAPGPRGFEAFYLSDSGATGDVHRAAVERRAERADQDSIRAIVGDIGSEVARAGGARLASVVRASLRGRLPGPDRGVKSGSYTLLAASSVPAVVVEMGFLNHPDEGAALATAEYQDRLADGLAHAIRRYLAEVGYTP